MIGHLPNESYQPRDSRKIFCWLPDRRVRHHWRHPDRRRCSRQGAIRGWHESQEIAPGLKTTNNNYLPALHTISIHRSVQTRKKYCSYCSYYFFVIFLFFLFGFREIWVFQACICTFFSFPADGAKQSIPHKAGVYYIGSAYTCIWTGSIYASQAPGFPSDLL